ncbi:glycosyltransferase [Fundidesulfovibrio butyratiphilus]
MKIDLHVHSRHSTRPSQWILQKLGCSESYTDPLHIYNTAKTLGMDMVTITDHNTIQGALEIAHLPDTFISVEITTYFPEDGCKAHVLAHDITEAQFADIQNVRENIFDLTKYLHDQSITHVCAHPLYGVNNRLTTEHVEKIMLLFKQLECNGSRDVESNIVLRRITAQLTPAILERLADKHGLEPLGRAPWIKTLTGGSDDHGGLNIARMHTVVPEATNLAEFLEGVRGGKAQPSGKAARPETMAHNLYAIAYQFSKNRFGLDKHVQSDVFLSFADRFLSTEAPREAGWRNRVQSFFGERRYKRGKAANPGDLKTLLWHEAAKLVLEDPLWQEIAKNGLPLPADKGQEWMRFVNKAAHKVIKSFGDHVFDRVSHGNLFDMFQAVGSAGALYAVIAPFFVSYSVFHEGREFSRKTQEAFTGVKRKTGTKVGHFTDTFFEINGVARTLQQSLGIAFRTGKDLTIITCDPHARDFGPGVRNFQPIGVYALPEYPEQKMYYPPVLEMIRYIYEQGFTHLHVSTPGPIGLAALLAAKILGLPLHGTYHTQIPQYARQLTGDEGMEDLMWRYTVWFYNQMDTVFAPSRDTLEELLAKGVRSEKVLVYPRGVDIQAFHPSKRNGFLERYDTRGDRTLLYVGRLSKEKNLDILADAYMLLRDTHPDVNLVLVGDGPYATALREKLAGSEAVFTGYLEGEALAACYASCDLFLFPSLTDTFGNVILEAQASGLPVVAGNSGGPKENILDGRTGLVLPSMNAEDLARAVSGLLADPGRMADMGREARASMEGRSLEKAFVETWALYEAAQ